MSDRDDIDVATLRANFDRSFAAPIEERSEGSEYIELRVGDEPYALALTDVRDISRLTEWTPAPSQSPALLGVVARARDLVAVFDLGPLLGGTALGSEGWLVRPATRPDLGFAFALLEGQRRAVPRDVQRRDPLVCAQLDGEPSRPVLDVDALLGSLAASTTGSITGGTTPLPKLPDTEGEKR